MRFSIINPKLFLTPVLFIVFFACRNSKEIPFPENETGFFKPVFNSLQWSEAEKISWSTPDPDSIKPPEVKSFNLENFPSASIDLSSFKPFIKPVEESSFNWNDLRDTSFSIDALEEKPLQVKTWRLPEPQKIPVLLPKSKNDLLNGISFFGPNEGLPASRIDDVTEDHYGMVWFICNGELYRYMGSYIEKYSLENKPALIKITEDRFGLLWLCTDRGNGIYIVDTKAKLQRHIPTNNNVFSIVQDYQGLYWVASIWEGVYIIDWNKRTIRNFRRTKERNDENIVLNIMEDRKQRIWISDRNGISVIDSARQKKKFLSSIKTLQVTGCWKMQEDKEGRIWISAGFKDKSIYVIYPETGIIKRIGEEQGIPKMTIGVAWDQNQNNYLGADSILYVIDKNLQGFKQVVFNEKYIDYWTGHIASLKDGNIWMGTRTNGIILFNTTGLSPEYLNTSRGLTGNSVWGLGEDNSGQVWVGGRQKDEVYNIGFLNVIDSARKKVYDLSKSFNPFYGVYGLTIDKQGKVYTGILPNGIQIFDGKKNTVSIIGKSQGIDNSRYFQTIMADNQGRIWIAYGHNIIIYYSETGAIKILNEDLLADISGVAYQSLFQDNEGRIWVGTTSKGVFVIDSSIESARNFTTKDGLSGKEVYNITTDKNNRVWIATENGITILNTKDNSYCNITQTDGLADPSVYSLLPADGSMYAGTGNGLTIFTEDNSGETKNSLAGFRLKSFKKENGLAYTDFHTVNLRSKDGALWFPLNGKVVAYSSKQPEDSSVSPVYITDINILDQSFDFSDSRIIGKALQNDSLLSRDTFYLKDNLPADTGYLQKNNIQWDDTDGPFNMPVNLELPYDQNYISFRFTGTGTSSSTARYRYILDGIDKNWSAVTDKPFSENYRDLPPGEYSFKVCLIDLNGLQSKPAIVSFTISPPWWKTWWAYALYILAGVFIIAAYARYRSRQLRQKNIELEQKIGQRTAELSKSLEDLKTTQKQLIQSEKMASLGELTAGIAHEIQNPLNFVNNFSDVNEELLSEMKDELGKGKIDDAIAIANDVIENQKKINHHGKRADAIVKGMLQHSRINNGIKEPTDINKLADEYLRLAYHGLRAKDKSFNATMKTDFDETIGSINIVPQDIGRVILNLITNAFYAAAEKKKHALAISAGQPYEPTVSVSTKKINGKVEVSVRDNGNGIPQKVFDKIFQPFFTTKPTGQGTGLGLSLAYDIVKAHGGELNVATKEGSGSVFTIQLPFN